MPNLGVVENTLFVPMLGRIYASEYCPRVLYDSKALELKKKLPPGLLERDGQSQYTLLASAARSANMDRSIRTFLRRRPDGVIVQLGCGLETTYDRCDNGRTRWYAVDLPHVVAYRRTLLPEPERETYLAGDAFGDAWLRRVRADAPDAPLLVTAGGLFHYFEAPRVRALLQMLGRSGAAEVVFDAVSRGGMAMMRRKYLKQVGHADARMFFYVDSAEALAAQLGGGTRVLAEEPYYGQAWVNVTECTFANNEVGFHFNSTGQSASDTRYFDNTFTGNGTGILLESVPTDITMVFDGSTFSDNGTDLDNPCGHPIDTSNAVFA